MAKMLCWEERGGGDAYRSWLVQLDPCQHALVEEMERRGDGHAVRYLKRADGPKVYFAFVNGRAVGAAPLESHAGAQELCERTMFDGAFSILKAMNCDLR